MMEAESDILGWIARFDREARMREAARALCDRGCRRWEIVSPYPCSIENTGLSRGRAFRVAGTCGALCGGGIVVLWLWLTQTVFSDLLLNQGRVPGQDLWFAYLPAIFVGMLLGSGVCIALLFFLAGRSPAWVDRMLDASGLDEQLSDMPALPFAVLVDASCGKEGREALVECAPDQLIDVPALTQQEGGMNG